MSGSAHAVQRRPTVFVCHVDEDRARVARLCGALSQAGIDAWWSLTHIPPGRRWKDAICEAIRGGEFFIACFSDNYWSRHRTFANEELVIACEELRQRPRDKAWLIPVRLTICAIPAFPIGPAETLRDLQWVDLWRDWEAGVGRIVDTVRTGTYADARGEGTPGKPPKTRSSPPPCPPKKILVVDDERQLVKLVEINLRRAGHSVTCAYDGVEALERVAADRPDMVILDIKMHRMDGFEVLRRLRQDPATVDLPVIMLTVKAEYRDAFEGWRGGATAYLNKPFNPHELMVFMARIFSSTDSTQGDDGGDGSKVWEL